MNREQLMSVLIAPHVTEKTSLAMQNHNQYTFRVRRDATKTDVKKAVELMFDVKVKGVQVVNEPGKRRRFGKSLGRTQDWKKAYVSLERGQTIDYEARATAFLPQPGYGKLREPIVRLGHLLRATNAV